METLLAILIGAAVLWYVFTRNEDAPTPGRRKADKGRDFTEEPPGPVAFHWPKVRDYSFEFQVVGESHYQPALQRIAGDHGDQTPNKQVLALLVPESNNPHDKSAVRVVVDRATVGYLDRDDARGFRRRLGAKKLTGKTTSCDALIMGGYLMQTGKRASYGIVLDIKPFE